MTQLRYRDLHAPHTPPLDLCDALPRALAAGTRRCIRNFASGLGKSKLPQYAFSKRVLFIEKETYWVAYADLCDQAGELWKGWIMTLRFARRASDHPGVTVYPDEQAFNPGAMMVDIQLEHATKG